MARGEHPECIVLEDSDDESFDDDKPTSSSDDDSSAKSSRSASTAQQQEQQVDAPVNAMETVELTSEEDSDDLEILEGEELEKHDRDVDKRRKEKHKKGVEAPRAVKIIQPNYDTVSPSYPLPKPPIQIIPEDYAQYFHPREARMRRMKDLEWRKKYEEMAPVRAKRTQEQREKDGTDWKSYWSLEDVSASEEGQFDGAAFFPYGDLKGLEALSDVFATVSGDKVQLWQANDMLEESEVGHFDNRYDGSRAEIGRVATTRVQTAESSPAENLLALAWSVNTSTWPFTPILAVGGTGRIIYIFNVDLVYEESGEVKTVKLRLDRTIVGPGKAIIDLKFSLSHPHLLVSASDDRTVRLLDPTVPRAATAPVSPTRENRLNAGGKPSKPHKQSKQKKLPPPPPPPGETIAILANDGHTKPLLSVDIHPRFPLILTTGLDGQVLIWKIPEQLRGPTWPTKELYQHPTPPTKPQPPPPILSAPLFASSSIHSKWCDHALWASATTTHIISKAGRPPSKGAPTEGKEIKLWIPVNFDRRPYTSTPRSSELDDDPALMAHRLSERASTFPDGVDNKPLSSAFQVYRKIDIEDDNALGERMGLHLLPTQVDAADDPDAILETLLFTPTANEPALYAFRPFGPLPSPTEPPTDSLSPTDELKALVEPIMPRGIDRLLYDWSPRLKPGAVMDVDMARIAGLGEKGKGKAKSDLVPEELRVRCTAVQPEGAKWVVAVGDGGLRMLWRRRRLPALVDGPAPMDES